MPDFQIHGAESNFEPGCRHLSLIADGPSDNALSWSRTVVHILLE